MSTKITIDQIKQLVEAKGFKLLTIEYKNNHQKLDVMCSNGHIYHPTVKSLKRGGGCSICYNGTSARRGVKARSEKIQEAIDIAKAKGGECLSDSYINNRSKLKFRCAKGHEWETDFKCIRRAWCPTCSLIKSPNQKYYQEAIEIATVRKGYLLSSEYIGAHSNMTWKCSNGHEWLANLNSIKNGSWCPECSRGFSERICKKIFESMFDNIFIKTRPLWLVSDSGTRLELDGYCESLGIAFEHNGIQHYNDIYNSNNLIKTQQRDAIKVQRCIDHNVSLIVIPAIFSFIQIEDLIPYILAECDRLKVYVPNRNVTLTSLDLHHIKVNNSSFEEKLKTICDIAIAKGGKCLSKHYNSTSMQFVCGCGFVWSTTPGSIINGHWCLRCGHKVPITIEDMQKIAVERGGLCLSKEYINNHLKLEWQCSCGNIWTATYNAIQRGDWCPKCGIIRRANAKRISIDAYQEAATKKGGKCLSTTITSCFDRLEFECACGNRWFGRADQIKNTKQWCPVCANKRKGNRNNHMSTTYRTSL
jgi:hypothetical protein